MLIWIIQISIISIIFIFLVHHLITFFKTTLTVPKIRDLVNCPSQKYKNIFETISVNYDVSSSTTNIDLLPSLSSSDSMKDELKTFLKKQLKPENENNNEVLALDSMPSGFSTF